jgi:hypothetical protein
MLQGKKKVKERRKVRKERKASQFKEFVFLFSLSV